jgi:NTP pyrophosphatase (non-canonical NTP hydrolase)
MTFEMYQQKARETAQYPDIGGIGLVYPVIGLAGEAGEVSDKFKKILRDHNGKLTQELRMGMVKELGDCLWYLANIAWELGIDLKTVAEINIAKLEHRVKTNTIQGNGDEREKAHEIPL